MPDNHERILKAQDALFPYKESDDLDIDVTTLTDLLTDLRHYADAHGIDFYKATDISYQHYLEEKGN